MVLIDKLMDVAKAIRTKTRNTAVWTLNEMPDKILKIETGKMSIGIISITENGV